VILVGDDPASAVYVRNKVRACEEAGFHSVLERYEASMSQSALLARIAALNAEVNVHGILVQMPLPPHLDPQAVIEAIAPAKDVDGFSIASAGQLMTGLPGLRPATPLGCMKLIESTGVALRGKHAVVIGRSNTVGKPMAAMVKPGAIVIDVGINRRGDGKLCGDVEFEAVREALGPQGFISPVPGGVGPMTIAMLLMNTLQAAEGAVP
jgi:methylenetetrahydrofolate dehydrogenase (NADP+)/methenyltetrahydrofolate cyclohydrolase